MYFPSQASCIFLSYSSHLIHISFYLTRDSRRRRGAQGEMAGETDEGVGVVGCRWASPPPPFPFTLLQACSLSFLPPSLFSLSVCVPYRLSCRPSCVFASYNSTSQQTRQQQDTTSGRWDESRFRGRDDNGSEMKILGPSTRLFASVAFDTFIIFFIPVRRLLSEMRCNNIKSVWRRVAPRKYL